MLSHNSARPSIRSATGRLTGGDAIDDYDLELETSDIDLDHDGKPVGPIVYAELGRGNQLAVVGVLDSDEITTIEQPVYFSGNDAPHGSPGLRERSLVAPRAPATEHRQIRLTDLDDP